ncbi:MAG TPA: ATP-binding protein, partial [Polyangiales bacterium]|nr:ATP-binding protein [Polyangiales bacterium]
MNQDDRIEQVLGLVLALAGGDLDARLETGSRTEPLDGVIETLNMLAEELSASMAALKRSEASFRSLIERSPDAMFVHREDVLVYANASALALLGVQAMSELDGSSVPPLLVVADAAKGSTRSQDGSRKLEGQLTRRDGSKVEVDVASILVNFDGRPATLSIARDISARKELMARAMEMDRMISVGTLAAGVGHEINTPLAYVISNLDFALRELGAAERAARPDDSNASRVRELQQALKDAREGAEKVREIVRDLRTFSSTRAKDSVPFELAPVLVSSIQMAFNEIRHRARLVRDFRIMPMIAGSPSRLGQVFLNLLINAAHAIPEGCADRHTITVRGSCESKEVRIDVSDTGVGIEHEHLARVFDPFFTTKPVGHGTGLGLFVCQRIVREHGGRIEVQSQLGQGSTFSVILPAQEVVPQVKPVPSPVVATPRRVRVLVVDDEPLMARGLARILSREHDVSTLTSAREALKCLMENDTFDAVLCDLMMPEMTGVDLHRELERRRPDIARRVLFFTGGAFTPATHAFVERMADRCLEKPLDVTEVRRKLAQLSV